MIHVQAQPATPPSRAGAECGSMISAPEIPPGAAAGDAPATIPVTLIVTAVEPVRDRGALVSLAAVGLARLLITFQGPQVRRTADGGFTCKAPHSGIRTANGFPLCSCP